VLERKERGEEEGGGEEGRWGRGGEVYVCGLAETLQICIHNKKAVV
jgi:hypothetical protein